MLELRTFTSSPSLCGSNSSDSSIGSVLTGNPKQTALMDPKLYVAAADGEIHILQQENNTILHVAAKFGQADCVNQILRSHSSTLLQQPNKKRGCYTNSQIPINKKKKKKWRGRPKLQRNEKKNYIKDKSLVFVRLKTSSLVRSYNLLKTNSLTLGAWRKPRRLLSPRIKLRTSSTTAP